MASQGALIQCVRSPGPQDSNESPPPTISTSGRSRLAADHVAYCMGASLLASGPPGFDLVAISQPELRLQSGQ
jgi:hypothetical protein